MARFSCYCQRANSSSSLGETRVWVTSVTAEGPTADTWGGIAIISSPHLPHVMRFDLGRLVDPLKLHHADLVVIHDEPGHLFPHRPDAPMQSCGASTRS